MIIKGLILFFIWLCNVAHRVRASFLRANGELHAQMLRNKAALIHVEC